MPDSQIDHLAPHVRHRISPLCPYWTAEQPETWVTERTGHMGDTFGFRAEVSMPSFNRIEREPFWSSRSSNVGSMFVFAVDTGSPHDGASRMNLPMWKTHAPCLSA
jgi:hypothetical protein